MKREALYGSYKIKDTDSKLQEYVGISNEFIKSLKQNCSPNIVTDGNALPIKETLLLASCNYEIGTKWGKEVGFMYGTVCEGVIYERGFIGIYHDWCENFSTYSRTYDLFHTNGLFSLYQDKCNREDIMDNSCHRCNV